uniref:Thiamine pyrophosphate enzyme TPP-binding domain-containing protein n=1 Tax=Salix viminalis TaxID=40686 RepID=A0A6N2NLM7_SALVM
MPSAEIGMNKQLNQYKVGLARETKNGTDFKAWREELNEQKVKCPLTFNTSGEEIILQHAFLMNYLMQQLQKWAALSYKCKRQRQWLKSGGLGAMVFGFPAAIANPDAIAVDMDGVSDFVSLSSQDYDFEWSIFGDGGTMRGSILQDSQGALICRSFWNSCFPCKKKGWCYRAAIQKMLGTPGLYLAYKWNKIGSIF